MKRPLILMLEPDRDDQYITEVFFKEHLVELTVEFVSNEEELTERLVELEEAGAFPSLVLLSIRNDHMTGLQLIRELKTDPEHLHIPVVVLCTSNDHRLVKLCYAAGANSFICKPAGERNTNEKILNFLRYWFQTVELVTGSKTISTAGLHRVV